MENGQSIEVEEQLPELHERAWRDGPEGEDARIVQAAELYAVRNGTDLATAIAAMQRGER